MVVGSGAACEAGRAERDKVDGAERVDIGVLLKIS
jgi:hypothetical protein